MTAHKRRSAGILLHPTSLPGRYGIGDLGPLAYGWVEALARAKQTWWQILPLTPTGFGDSPYQSYSAFAGNTNMISPEKLVMEGLLSSDDLTDTPIFTEDRVDFDAVIQFKIRILAKAYENFKQSPNAH